MSMSIAPAHDVSLEGKYANVASRAAAFGIDIAVIAVTFAVASAVVEKVLGVFLAREVSVSDSRDLSTVVMVVWAFVYFAYPLATAGRTLGMGILGLQAVEADGTDLTSRGAVVRTLALPLSFLFLGLGFAFIVVRRDHRALHDLISGAAVVYSWNARAAHLAFLRRDRPAAL
jgi:uncharacterized RDD family membrane protein YckC